MMVCQLTLLIQYLKIKKWGYFNWNKCRIFKLKDDNEFENYNFLDGICNGYTREVKVFGNNIWIGNGSGLAVYNGKKFKPIAYTNEFFNGANITVIETDSEGNIWLGTQGNGLLKYDGLKFTTYRKENGLPSNFILDILIDNNGVWIATQKGLVKMKDEKIIGINNPEKDGLKDFIVRSISKSKDGIYFISSSGGIFEYDLNSFKKIMTEQGLKSNEFIFDIKLADDGILQVEIKDFIKLIMILSLKFMIRIILNLKMILY